MSLNESVIHWHNSTLGQITATLGLVGTFACKRDIGGKLGIGLPCMCWFVFRCKRNKGAPILYIYICTVIYSIYKDIYIYYIHLIVPLPFVALIQKRQRVVFPLHSWLQQDGMNFCRRRGRYKQPSKVAPTIGLPMTLGPLSLSGCDLPVLVDDDK